ncbi:MAG: MFS transporter [Massiliimalia sp.]|jgi:YQGE family putative transporter
MKLQVTHISYLLSNALGMDRLTQNFLNFARSHLCFLIATNIHGVFVNILLLREADSVNITIYYNMVSFLASGIAMMIAGALAKYVDLKIITFIGIGFHIVAYGIFLIFMESITSYVILVAILLGMGGGFFYLTYFVSLSAYSTDDTRDVSIAFIGIVGGAIALAVPTISGAVIGAFEGLTGYTIMFGCAFIIAGIAFYLFTKLPKVPPVKKPPKYFQCLKQIHTNKSWFFVTAQIFLRSVREGVFAFFLNVLLFQYVQNESIIGINSLLVGFISIFAQYTCGRISKPGNRIKMMTVATITLLASVSILYLELNAATVLLLSFLNAFFVVVLMNPSSSIDFIVIQSTPDGFTCREEYLGLFEFYRALGRNVGLIFLLLMPQTSFGYVTALMTITGLQFLTVLCAKSAVKSLKKT